MKSSRRTCKTKRGKRRATRHREQWQHAPAQLENRTAESSSGADRNARQPVGKVRPRKEYPHGGESAPGCNQARNAPGADQERQRTGRRGADQESRTPRTGERISTESTAHPVSGQERQNGAPGQRSGMQNAPARIGGAPPPGMDQRPGQMETGRKAPAKTPRKRPETPRKTARKGESPGKHRKPGNGKGNAKNDAPPRVALPGGIVKSSTARIFPPLPRRPYSTPGG